MAKLKFTLPNEVDQKKSTREIKLRDNKKLKALIILNILQSMVIIYLLISA